MIDLEQRLKGWHVALLMLALAFAGYWKVLGSYWFLDDTTAPFAGLVLSRDITKIFTYRFDVIYVTPIWRVMVALSYLPNYLISGLEPWSYHLVSILLHAGNGWLVFLIVRKLARSSRLALLVAFLFSVSLNKADAVMMIAHRTTLLGAFFALAALFFYACLVTDGFSWKRSAGCLLAFGAAVGSYETALVLPGVFFALGFLSQGRAYFRSRQFLMAMILALAAALLIFHLDMGGENMVVREATLAGRLLHMMRNVIAVLPTFVIPPFLLQPANELYYSEGTGFNWIEWSGLTMLLLLLGAGLATRERLAIFGLAFFLLIALPSAKVQWLFYPDPFTMAVHKIRWSIGKFSYLSSFGLYLAGGVLLWRLFDWCASRLRNRLPFRVATGALLAGYLCFNVYWLHQRALTWDFISNLLREQITAVRALDLKISPDMVLYQYNFVIFGRHAQAIFRVLFQDPELDVRDLRDYRPDQPFNRNIVLMAQRDRVHTFSLQPGMPSPLSVPGQ